MRKATTHLTTPPYKQTTRTFSVMGLDDIESIYEIRVTEIPRKEEII